ncbi:MAG: glycosyltransferase [Rhodocyclaceae bacterium]|nr:glycosyltransferase [Rhodocyclaceae bacterium]
MLRVLSFTSLFPNCEQPRHGIFIRTRLAELSRSDEVALRVIAPIPWFPFRAERFGRFGAYARVPGEECWGDLRILHPRYLSVPRLGRLSNPVAMAVGSYRAARGLIAAGFEFDLIDAHYLFPDAVAASFLARWLDKPLMVTARGSDLNQWPELPAPRRAMIRMARQASACVAVSASLARRYAVLGVPAANVSVIRNGVDTDLFHDRDREGCRSALGLEGHVVLSVGNLIELKGHHLVIEAIAQMPHSTLVVIGEGQEYAALRALCNRLGVEERVRFVGVIPQDALRRYYVAADALVLASRSEGWPNVLLEAMACGTPVVATPVGAAPEIVTSRAFGRLLPGRDAGSVRGSLIELRATGVDRLRVREHAQKFGWAAVTAAQIECMRRAVAGGSLRAAA